MCYTDLTITYDGCPHRLQRTLICPDKNCLSYQQTYITETKEGVCVDCSAERTHGFLTLTLEEQKRLLKGIVIVVLGFVAFWIFVGVLGSL